MFNSDAMQEMEKRVNGDMLDGVEPGAMLKMSVGGVTVDFAAMIEEVVGDGDNVGGDVQTVPQLSEERSQGMTATPEAPVA